jgi:hypothetical protein
MECTTNLSIILQIMMTKNKTMKMDSQIMALKMMMRKKEKMMMRSLTKKREVHHQSILAIQWRTGICKMLEKFWKAERRNQVISEVQKEIKV